MAMYPEKIPNLIERVKAAVESGNYLDTFHSKLRQGHRSITRPEIIFVLKNGFHEKRKDKFDHAFKEWNYAVRGKTIESKDLRVIVSFDKSNMLIITAIDLGK